MNAISQDLVILNLMLVDAEDQDEWRKRTHVVDPSLDGDGNRD